MSQQSMIPGAGPFRAHAQKYQSGETDITGRITKIGDSSVRTALYQAAYVIVTQPIKGCSNLKS
jgi:transposase